MYISGQTRERSMTGGSNALGPITVSSTKLIPYSAGCCGVYLKTLWQCCCFTKLIVCSAVCVTCDCVLHVSERCTVKPIECSRGVLKLKDPVKCRLVCMTVQHHSPYIHSVVYIFSIVQYTVYHSIV